MFIKKVLFTNESCCIRYHRPALAYASQTIDIAAGDQR